METNIQDRPGQRPLAGPQVLAAEPPAGIISWMKGHERGILLAAIALQIVVLVAMMILRLTILVTGQTVWLRVQPVDPRDLFRGDYVILSYDFTRMGLSGIPGGPPTWSQERRGRPVYIELVPEGDGQHYHTSRVSLERPPATATYIQGAITGWGQIECGIESYFVQEGKGREYEDAVRQMKLSAEVSITADGKAALKRLHIKK